MELPKTEADIISQIKREYQRAYQYWSPKRLEAQDRYRLYSNQKKNKELVGDTTLFTITQTIVSKLYEDRMVSVFEPNHPDDDEKVNALNPISLYDYQQMEKDIIDYDWTWYACFWGASFLDVTEWDFKESIMRPSVINNATFLLDPECSSVNGDRRGFGAAKYWGREIVKTKYEMREEKFENIETLRVHKDGTLKKIDDVARANAQGLGSVDEYRTPEENESVPLLEWWTIIDGKKWLFVTDTGYSAILRAKECTYDLWPLVQRKLFPIPGDPLGVSIPDLVEDKQRAKSVLTNLGLMHAKADLYPMYIYDRNAIAPTTDTGFGFNKWIPSDGPVTTSVAPLQKPQAGGMVSYILNMLDASAQAATAATAGMQGVLSGESRSANEYVRAFNAADERISVGAKVFGWSERDFWRWWLRQYKTYFPQAQKKFVRVQGAFGAKFLEVKGDDFTFEKDPDIMIESKIISDNKNKERKQDVIAFKNLTQQDSAKNLRYEHKKLAKVFGYTSDEITRLYPPTADEMQAEVENVKLAKNQLVNIDMNDDHVTHLEIHAKADDTKSAIVHIEAHKKALMLQRESASQAPEAPANPNAATLPVQQSPSLEGGSSPAAEAPEPYRVQQ